MFIDDLKVAKRPAILVGGGAYAARDLINTFALSHGIPCFRTWNALDVITDDRDVYCGTIGTYGGPGRNFGIQNCDLLLTLGCRISGRITGGMPDTFARASTKYIIDIEQGHDCLEFMQSINCGGYPARIEGWFLQCKEWLRIYDPVKPEMLTGYDLHHYGFMRRLSEMLPSNAVVVYDTGGSSIMMGHCFKSKFGQRIFSSNGNSPMGFAMCGAIGAWFADPTRPIVCIIGDGGIQLNIQEFQTLKHYNIPLRVFILNNMCLGNTRSYQVQNGMAQVACGPDGYSAPDFVEIIKAYGMVPFHIPHTASIDCVVKQVMAHDGPAICDVQHKYFHDYAPRMSLWNAGIEEMFPPLPHDEFLSNMIIPPLEGWQERQLQYRRTPDA